MAQTDTEQDKSELATPYKLEQARQRGQVARSTDAVVAAVFVALTLAWFGLGDRLLTGLRTLAQVLLATVGNRQWSVRSATSTFEVLGFDLMSLLLPVLAIVALAAAAATVAQTGPVFSAEPIKPQWERLNPAAGLKRLFSLRLAFDTFKSVLKLALLGAVLWLTIRSDAGDLVLLGMQTTTGQANLLQDHAGALLMRLTLALIVIALIDLGYSRWEYSKKMRMSSREVRDEHKQREGDPRIRSRLRELRAAMLNRSRSTNKLPQADVLITNPTHLAVALVYRHGEMAAPQLLTKGAGEIARKLREAARAHGIPIVQNPPLARELYRRLDLDGWVPEDLYPTVARILVWVYAQRDAKAARATP